MEVNVHKHIHWRSHMYAQHTLTLTHVHMHTTHPHTHVYTQHTLTITHVHTQHTLTHTYTHNTPSHSTRTHTTHPHTHTRTHTTHPHTYTHSILETVVEEMRVDVVGRRCKVMAGEVDALALSVAGAQKAVTDLKGECMCECVRNEGRSV